MLQIVVIMVATDIEVDENIVVVEVGVVTEVVIEVAIEVEESRQFAIATLLFQGRGWLD